jgi:protein TonB
MISNRRMIALSVALHLLGVFGLWAVGQLSAPVLSLQTPQAINVRFPAPPAPPSRENASSDPAVSRETPKPERTKPKATPEKTKATPKPDSTPKATPKKTPEPKATPKPKETSKPKATEPPKPKATERPAERTSSRAPPQPTRTYYPKPPREAASHSSSPPRPAATSARPRETAAPSNAAPALSASGAKQGALIGVRGGPSLNAYYSRQAIALIAANFKVPPERQSEASCVIGFDILPDGRIVNPRIAKSSGDPNLDILAIDALKRTERLPPLPDEFRSRSVEAQLTFSFTTSTSGN